MKRIHTLIRVNFIGCGRIAHKHIEVLSSLNDLFTVVGVTDLDQNKLKKFSERYCLASFATADEMIAKTSPDVLVILTDSGQHAKNVIDLAHYGKDFVVEKPMALTKSDCLEMIRLCDKNSCKLNIVKQNRFNRPVLAARDLFEQSAFGDLILGTVRVRWSRDQSYYDQAPWRGTWKNDGGVLANQAAHHLDLLTWFFGEVESVYAITHRALVNIEAEDTAVVSIKFKNGALGAIEATTATRPKDLEGSFSLIGSLGSVEIGGFAVNELKHCNLVSSEFKTLDKDSISQNPPNVYGFGHVEYYRNLSNAWLGKPHMVIDGAQAMKTVELLEAIYESSSTNERVKIGESVFNSRLGK